MWPAEGTQMNQWEGASAVLSVAKEEGEFAHFLTDLWSDGKPLAMLFRTENRGYIYDTGTNRILACDDLEFSILRDIMTMGIEEGLHKILLSLPPNNIIPALKSIRDAIDGKNILKTKRATQFGLSSHYRNLEELVTNSLGLVLLEITERCNLRCGYCIYNPRFTQKRDHGTRDMSQGTAFQAINYLARNSQGKKDVAITFYGGEPLLRFPFIRSCVDYARKVLLKKDLSFSLTTNGTLLTLEMADFFAAEGFGVHVSLDGPQDIQDRYRRDFKGNGSFHKTIAGLRTLYEAYGDQKEKLSLSMVYAPPFQKKIYAVWPSYGMNALGFQGIL